MGLTPDHASTIPLVLNLDTGAITPQFHVVFDDWFTTVTTSIDDLPDFNSTAWSKMFGDSEYQFIRDEDGTQVDPKDFMTSEAITTRQNQVSKAMDTTMPPRPCQYLLLHLHLPSLPALLPLYQLPPHLPALLHLLCLLHQLVHHLQLSTTGRNHTCLSHSNRGGHQGLKIFIHLSHCNRGSYLHQTLQQSHWACKQHSMLNMDPSKKSFASIVALDLNEATSLPLNPHLHHLPLTKFGITDIQAGKAALSDPDTLTSDQVLLDPDIEEWKKSAHKEITLLESKDTWVEVPTSEATSKILPGTWEFHCKRAPTGIITKFKARYCV